MTVKELSDKLNKIHNQNLEVFGSDLKLVVDVIEDETRRLDMFGNLLEDSKRCVRLISNFDKGEV